MKRLIIPFLIILGLMTFVYAGFEVNLDPEGILTDKAMEATQTVVHNFNISNGNLSSSEYTCYLYSTENGASGVGSFSAKLTESNRVNDTNYNFTTRNGVAEVSGDAYTWGVNCTDSEGTHNWSSSNYTYGVDVTDPSVTINAPSDASWANDNNSVVINLTVVDDNNATCVLDTNINASGTGGYTSDDYTSAVDSSLYTNNTAFTFPRINTTGDVNFTDDNDGYNWNYICNDTAGNSVEGSANYTFYVDTLLPSAFTFTVADWLTDNSRALFNDTTSSDYTPAVGWGTTTETNFSRYEIFFYQDSIGNATFIDKNISAKATNTTNMSALAADKTYHINITAFDLAGNKRQMTGVSANGYIIATDSTNRALDAGWNIVGNPGNVMTLANLLTYTGATTVSVWNSSHSFQSHVSGGSNGGVNVSAGGVFLAYVATDTTFSDLVWNETAMDSALEVNLTNQTASDWNLVMNTNYSNSFNFRQLDNYTNTCATEGQCNFNNITYFSHFNNSAASGSKYVPFVNNWTINSGRSFAFGETIWAYVGDGDVDDVTINWGTVGDY